MLLLLSALPTFAPAPQTAAVAPRAVRIMPMGDSITEWDCRMEGYTDRFDKPVAPNTAGAFVSALGGYRGFLGLMLTADELAFDFVGSRYSCGNHEGWGGRTIEFLAGIAEDALARHRPDLVLFMGGTNDFFFAPPTGVGANVSEAEQRLRRLLDISFHALPNVTFLLSTVTHINATRCADYPHAPWHPPACPATMDGAIRSFNARLPSLAAEYAARGLDVQLHDVNAVGWEDGDYWIWGIHFNSSGFEKMAGAWRTAIRASGRVPLEGGGVGVAGTAVGCRVSAAHR
jgi:lysophospholipase L1-like esterase